MMNGLWGKKIGMTQIFSDDYKVVPVTAIDLAQWYITQIKTIEKDGYAAVQLGNVKARYHEQPFSLSWLQEPKKYFSALKEVRLNEEMPGLAVGSQADIGSILAKGDSIDAFGVTKGAGFQGVVKRHSFTGGRASHGSTLGRATGSLSFMRSRGRVIKGKRMPGHMGVEACVIKNLEIVRIEPAAHIVFVKGSVPGKSGSLIFLKKCR